MKKILSVMACMTLVTCSGVMFAACGEKKETPKAATFTVADNVAVKAAAIVDELQENVYNNADALGIDNASYSYAEVVNKLGFKQTTLTEGYWVEAGKLANLKNVNSITIGGVEYNKASKFKLSIGNNNFIEDLVYNIDANGNVQIAGPVVAFELRNESSKIKFNNKEFNFVTGETGVEELKLGNAEFKNNNNIIKNDGKVTNVVTPVQDKTNEYDVKLSSSDDYLLLTPNTEAQPAEEALDENGTFLIRSVVDDKVKSFGITGVDEKGLGIYFGRQSDNTVDPEIDGKTIVQDVYYTETVEDETSHKSAQFTFNAEVEDYFVAKETATIENDVKTTVAALQANAYNKLENKDYTYAELLDAEKGDLTALADTDYYVEVADVRNTVVNSIKLGNFEYSANDTIPVSIGKNSHIIDKVFVVEEGKLKIAAPVLAIELLTAETIEINGQEKDFIANPTQPEELTIEKADAEGANEIAATAEAEKEYDVTIKDGNLMFGFKTESADLGSFVSRFVINDKAQYCITGMDAFDGGYGYGIYFGYDKELAEIAESYDGKTAELTLYYAPKTEGTAELTTLKLHFTVKDYFVANDKTAIENAVKTTVAALQANAYNKLENKDYTYAELLDAEKGDLTALADTDYYVEVADVRNTVVNSIKLGDFEYSASDTVSVSIGKNSHIIDKVFVVESGKLKIAAPVLAIELLSAETIEINGQENVFIVEPTQPEELTIESTNAFGTNEIAATADSEIENEYDVTIKDGNSKFTFKTETADLGSFVTRFVINGKAQYGLTGMDAVDDGYGYGVYFGYNKELAEIAESYDGKTGELTLYYAPASEGTAKLTKVTLHFTVEDATAD